MLLLDLVVCLFLLVPFLFKSSLLFFHVTTPFFMLPVSLLQLGFFFSNLLLLFFLAYYQIKTKEKQVPLPIRQAIFLLILLPIGFLFCILYGKHLFLASLSMLLYFSTVLFLYEKTSWLLEECTLFLNPIVLWSLYMTAVTITCCLLNLSV